MKRLMEFILAVMLILFMGFCAGAFPALEVFAEPENKEAEKIKAHCRQEWPNDYRMQAYCMEQQAEAGIEYHEFLRKHNVAEKLDLIQAGEKSLSDYPMVNIAWRAFRQWSTESFTDYRMIMYEIRNQVEAYRRIYRSKN